MSRRVLQVVMAVLGIIPIATSIAAFVLGPASMPGGGPVTASVDNEYRFLAAFWFGCGLVIYWVIPQVESRTGVFRSVAAIIFLGGVGRLISSFTVGRPTVPYTVAMGIELILVPLLIPWQASVARRARVASRAASTEAPSDGRVPS